MVDIIKEILNSSWIPGMLAVIGAIWFGVTYYRANKFVDAYREKFQQQLVDAYAFAEMLNSAEEDVYRVKKQDSDAMEFILSGGMPLPKLNGDEIEFCMCRLAANSDIPSLGFAVTVDEVYHGRNISGIQIILCPAAGAVAKWTVTFADGDKLVCENPIMGKLELRHSGERKLRAGDSIELFSTVEPVKRASLYEDTPNARSFRLRYELV